MLDRAALYRMLPIMEDGQQNDIIYSYRTLNVCEGIAAQFDMKVKAESCYECRYNPYTDISGFNVNMQVKTSSYICFLCMTNHCDCHCKEGMG